MIKIIDKTGREMATYPNEKAAARYAFNKRNEKLRPKDIYDGAKVYVRDRKVDSYRRTTTVSLIPCCIITGD